MTRADAIRDLEQEVGVLIRRVRRVIGVRARAVHESLQPASYLILAHINENGPLRASSIVEAFDMDKGAISRQVHHLTELGLIGGEPDPADGRANLLKVTDEGARRMQDVADHRRKWLDEQLGDWSEQELSDFVDELARYNRSLSDS